MPYSSSNAFFNTLQYAKYALATSAILAAVVTTVAPQPAAALSCLQQSQEEHFDNAKAVFVGQVSSIEKYVLPPNTIGVGSDQDVVKLKVLANIKGQEDMYALQVQQRTPTFPWGIQFKLNATYLVYAQQHREDLPLTVSLCGLTRQLAIPKPVSEPPVEPDYTKGTVTILASGDQFRGAPNMRVSLGKQTLVASQPVEATFGTPPKSYSYDITNYQGGPLKIDFLNDAWRGKGKDRNLYIQRVDLTFGNKVTTLAANIENLEITGSRYNTLIPNKKTPDNGDADNGNTDDFAVALRGKGSMVMPVKPVKIAKPKLVPPKVTLPLPVPPRLPITQ